MSLCSSLYDKTVHAEIIVQHMACVFHGKWALNALLGLFWWKPIELNKDLNAARICSTRRVASDLQAKVQLMDLSARCSGESDC